MGYETSLQLFIDGVWKSGEGRDCHQVVNPVDAQPIADLPYATKADLDEALAASERAWPEWRSTDVEKRGAILHKAAALLRERVDLIAATMTQEQGKVIAEAKAEVLASAQLFDRTLDGQRLDAIYSSPRRRALQTAELAVEQVGVRADHFIRVLLTER